MSSEKSVDSKRALVYCGISVTLGIGIGYLLRKYSARHGIPEHIYKAGGSAQMFSYLMSSANRTVPELKAIHEITHRKFAARAQMVSATDQLYLFKWLMPILKVRKAIEIGVFTGSSALMIAQGMPENGKLLAFDVSREYTDVAKTMWERARIAHKIELSLDGGLNGLDTLNRDAKERQTYDFAYIDAVKTEYAQYFEKLLPLMRKGGIMAFDNVLWKGRVADERVNDETTLAFRAFNKMVRDDVRVEMCLVNIGDGVLFCSVN